MMKIFVLMACLLVLSACRDSDWSHEKIHSNYAQYSYSKITYRARDLIHGVDVEFTHADGSIKTYLLVHSTPIPHAKIPVKFECDGVSTLCTADRLEGGQRFLLSADSAQILMDALLAEKQVILTIPGYQSRITPDGFTSHFKKIGRSSMENPFHLPF
jgi:hypothetical protein